MMRSITLFLLCTKAYAFTPQISTGRMYPTIHRQNQQTNLYAKKKKKPTSAMGFGKKSPSKKTVDPLEKTYDLAPPLQTTMMDEAEAAVAMEDFFDMHSDWHPLFASLAIHDNVPAAAHIDFNSHKDAPGIEFNDDAPWGTKLPATPDGPDKEDRVATISQVLDSFQKALTDIPVSEKLYAKDDEDDNDMHFLEEGRRLLVLQRFQVVDHDPTDENGKMDLFRTCWSEIYYLVTEGQGDIGSLIIIEEDDAVDDVDTDSDVDEIDLAHFVDTKIRLPLQFLGLENMLEVASFEREKRCVRLIQNLGAIPSLEERDAAVDAETQRDKEGFQ